MSSVKLGSVQVCGYKTQVLNLDNCQNHWTNATFQKHVYVRLCETHIFQVQAVNKQTVSKSANSSVK